MQAHVPVLLHECLEGLALKPDGIYVDGTLGRAGHAFEIASRLTTGLLVGIDRDAAAIAAAHTRLEPFADRVRLVHGNFRDIGAILERLGLPLVDGMLFDLGVSSPQLDETERGFSYMQDAPLDMRMDQSAALTAYEVVNSWSEAELKRILFAYGEERYAPRIAKAVVANREAAAIETTGQLVDVIKSAMPASALREKGHPAKRSFQAIRIAVNDELGAVEDMLESAVERLKPGGRLAVISFHSLEDRLVKNAISRREKGCTCPRDFPVCVCGFQPTLRAVTRKATQPSDEETEQNPRARSAKLRVAERI
ncbi:MAG: 16S rRNA (cytosine(1402)-N(4))-methyltransferase RsmH [Oscillospiraceae bacterium]|nr:16S rRNA (cytosine(1402)-N(4))-methyltransferase RsmH [Oscillospiraceae bacterium]